MGDCRKLTANDKDKPCPGVTYSDNVKRTSLKEVFSGLGKKIKNIHIGGKKEGPVYYTGITKKEAKKHTEDTKQSTLDMLESYHENETFMGYATDDSAPTVVTK